MFKVSEDIYLAANDSANHSKTYGVYQQSNADQDTYGHTVQTFVDPGVTEVEKITVLHWPVEENITQNKPVEFVIRKNGARGNVQVKVRSKGPRSRKKKFFGNDVISRIIPAR